MVPKFVFRFLAIISINHIAGFSDFARTLNQQPEMRARFQHDHLFGRPTMPWTRLNFVYRTRSDASCAADSLTRGYLLQVDADE